MKHILIIWLLIGMAFGQSSHRDLTTELLKDLHKAISDSTSITSDSLTISFVDDIGLETYLNSCLPEAIRETEKDAIGVSITDIMLTINSSSPKSMRNPRYLRQLELNVLFVHGGKEYGWSGKISDNLSKVQLKSLLDEEIPIQVRGDYSSGEPAGILIVLTTLGVFSLGAALFFIRT